MSDFGVTSGADHGIGTDDDDNIHEEDYEYVATLPSGVLFPVLTEDEADYITVRSQEYMTTFGFNTPSDLADLDQVVRSEMMLQRYDHWLSSGVTYAGKPVEPRAFNDMLQKRAAELRGLKKALGIDKVTRDRTSGEGSPAQKLASIMSRAKLLGIHRCRQLDRALDLTHELINIVETNGRTTLAEQKEIGCTVEDIMEWIRTVYIPEFRAIDEYFLEHEQRYWERD